MLRFLRRDAHFLTASIVLALLAAASTAGQAPPLTDFDAYAGKGVKDWNIPGLAVTVVKDGRVVFAKGYGVRELGKPAPVDTHTLFAIGSTTKAMTAAAVGILVDDGKVAWDDPVTKYLPWFQLEDPYVTRELTLRDLLTHRGGIPNTDFLWYGTDNSSSDILRRMRLVRPETSMRSHFTYQNVMYLAAGEVVAAASGMPWDAFIRTRILGPLGMTETIPTAATLSSQQNVASPHFTIGESVRVIRNASVDAVAPAGAIWSSVHDMSKWMMAMIDGGRIDSRTGARLVSEATYRNLFSPHAIVGADAFYPTATLTHPRWTTYGLGWFQEDYGGRAVDFHTGSIDGMVAIIGLIREERLGVYVLANLDHAELRHALMYRVFDAYGSGNHTRDWSADLLDLYGGLRKEAEAAERNREQERVTGTQPSLALDRYAGSYADPLRGTVLVSYAGGALGLQHGPGFIGTLEHWNYDSFRAVWGSAWMEPSFVSFALDRKGSVVSVELDGARFMRGDAGNTTEPR